MCPELLAWGLPIIGIIPTSSSLVAKPTSPCPMGIDGPAVVA